VVAPPQAHEAALRVLDGAVRAQASVLAFERVFLLAGLVFLFVLPLLYFLRTDRDARSVKPRVNLEV